VLGRVGLGRGELHRRGRRRRGHRLAAFLAELPPSWLAVPQPGQAASSRVPHSWQNTASAGLSWRHRGHFIQPSRARSATVGTVGRP
jgi:hypothetical protein